MSEVIRAEINKEYSDCYYLFSLVKSSFNENGDEINFEDEDEWRVINKDGDYVMADSVISLIEYCKNHSDEIGLVSTSEEIEELLSENQKAFGETLFYLSELAVQQLDHELSDPQNNVENIESVIVEFYKNAETQHNPIMEDMDHCFHYNKDYHDDPEAYFKIALDVLKDIVCCKCGDGFMTEKIMEAIGEKSGKYYEIFEEADNENTLTLLIYDCTKEDVEENPNMDLGNREGEIVRVDLNDLYERTEFVRSNLKVPEYNEYKTKKEKQAPIQE